MFAPMMALVLTVGAPLPAADTVLPADRGTRLEIEALRGRVQVETWAQAAVRIQTRAGVRADIGRSGSLIRVRPERTRRGSQDADFTIQVPSWMDVRIHGQQLDVSVRGAGNDVSVETIGGDIVVEGAGRVDVRTIQGAVTVRGVDGPVEIWSVNQGVTLSDIGGDISVETTNGAISLRGIRASGARATTVNGSIVYEGAIRENGRYAFTTHNGPISVHIAERANAMISAATYNGSFQSDFPVRLTGTSRDRQYHFTLGSGSARVELESFNGDIRLRRPR